MKSCDSLIPDMPDSAAPVFTLPEPFAGWFDARGWQARSHQLALTEAALAGQSALLIAPTGGGKTLAGFLASLIELKDKGLRSSTGIPALHTLYVSPLKALAVDVQRNLMAPVGDMGLDIRIETRTGDTPSHVRQRQRRNPPDVLLTTPEQLALFIASDHAKDFFADLKCVIVDEVHAMAASKRGDLLSLGLATLSGWARACRFIGLSATVKEPEELARWLAPDARIIRAAGGVSAEVDILVSREHIPWSGHSGRFAVPEVYEALKRSKMALVFVNTRSQAEVMFQELWRVNDDNLPIALPHAESRGVYVDARSRHRLGRSGPRDSDGGAEGRGAVGAADRPGEPPHGRGESSRAGADEPVRGARMPCGKGGGRSGRD